MNEEFKLIDGSKCQVGSKGTVIGGRGKILQRHPTHGVRHENVRVLMDHGAVSHRKVNELVMAAFGPERPSDAHQILHRDDDITNCAIDNLSWVQYKYGRSQLVPHELAADDTRRDKVEHRFDEPTSIYEYF